MLGLWGTASAVFALLLAPQLRPGPQEPPKTLGLMFQAPFCPSSHPKARGTSCEPANFRGQRTQALISGPASSPVEWQGRSLRGSQRRSPSAQAAPSLDWVLTVLGRWRPALPRNVSHVLDFQQTPGIWKPTSSRGRRTGSLAVGQPLGRVPGDFAALAGTTIPQGHRRRRLRVCGA